MDWGHVKVRVLLSWAGAKAHTQASYGSQKLTQARPEVLPVSGIMCSQGGHRSPTQMAKAFSSA